MTATATLCVGPGGATRRWYWAAKVRCLRCGRCPRPPPRAPPAASDRPWSLARTRSVCPPLCRLPGHTPAQEARCLADGNTPMSAPISARSAAAVVGPTPGMSPAGPARGANGASACSISRVQRPRGLLPGSRCGPGCARAAPGGGAGPGPPGPAAAPAAWPAAGPWPTRPAPRRRPRPRAIASSIRRPLTPRTSVATAASLRLALSSTFCSRLTSCGALPHQRRAVAASARAAPASAAGGMKLARSSPWRSRSASHSQSWPRPSCARAPP